jgi:hypothetical protein
VSTRKRSPLPAAVLAYFREQGAEGGRIGSKRRLVKLSPERRSELARLAARARWAKKRKTTRP